MKSVKVYTECSSWGILHFVYVPIHDVAVSRWRREDEEQFGKTRGLIPSLTTEPLICSCLKIEHCSYLIANILIASKG